MTLAQFTRTRTFRSRRTGTGGVAPPPTKPKPRPPTKPGLPAAVVKTFLDRQQRGTSPPQSKRVVDEFARLEQTGEPVDRLPTFANLDLAGAEGIEALILAGATTRQLKNIGLKSRAITRARDNLQLATTRAPRRRTRGEQITLGIIPPIPVDTKAEAARRKRGLTIVQPGVKGPITVTGKPKPEPIEKIQLGLPTPVPTRRPAPGEKLPVPKDIAADLKAIQRKGALIASAGTDFPGLLVQQGGARIAAAVEIRRNIERGDLTPTEAKAIIKELKRTPVVKGTLRDVGYAVPGVGSFLSYQDAQRSGFAPLETGFFIASTAFDALIFVVPLRAGGVRLVKLPKSAVTKISPIVVREAKFVKGAFIPPEIKGAITTIRKSRIIKDERGFIRLGPTASSAEELGIQIERIAVPAVTRRGVTVKERVVIPAVREPLTIPPAPPTRPPLQIPAVKPARPPLRIPTVKPGPPPLKVPTPRGGGLRRITPLRPKEISTFLTRRAEELERIKASRRVLAKQIERERVAAAQQKRIEAAQKRQADIDIRREELLQQRRDAIAKREGFGAKPAAKPKARLIQLLTKPVPLTKKEGKSLTEELTRTKTLPQTRAARLVELLSKTSPLTQAESKTLTDLLEQTQTVTRTQRARIVQPVIEPVIETETRPEPKPKAKPAVKPEVKPEVKPQVKPTTLTEPAPAPKPFVQPKPKPVTQQATLTEEGITFAPPPVKPTKKPTVPVSDIPPIPKAPVSRRPPVPIPFRLPSGKKLPIGIFPRIVFWKQGFQDVRGNLLTGKFSFKKTDVSGEPDKTFRVISFTKQEPKAQILPLGIVDVIVTRRMLDFKQTSKAKRKSLIRRQKVVA